MQKRNRKTAQENTDNGLARKKILIVSDAWNRINGVVTTLEHLTFELEKAGHDVKVIHPDEEKYPFLPLDKFGADIALPGLLKWKIGQEIKNYRPDGIFILTEGTLGRAARRYCLNKNLPFTTNYTTKWPEYFWEHAKIPPRIPYRVLRRFHNAAHSVLVTTQSMNDELKSRGFKNLQIWTQAVDLDKFNLITDSQRQEFLQRQGLDYLKPPFYLYVGRITAEKNMDVFLDMSLPGTKIVVGPGSKTHDLEELKRKYPDIVFTGPRQGLELAGFYAACDVFVFPSKKDTLGLVLLEALASGLPVVAFDVTGPRDVIAKGSKVGYLVQTDAQLREAGLQAWTDLQAGRITREQCRAYVLPFTWEIAARKLLDAMTFIQWEENRTSPAFNRKAG